MIVGEGLTEHFITIADQNFATMRFDSLLKLCGYYDAGYDGKVAKRYQEREG